MLQESIYIAIVAFSYNLKDKLQASINHASYLINTFHQVSIKFP